MTRIAMTRIAMTRIEMTRIEMTRDVAHIVLDPDRSITDCDGAT